MEGERVASQEGKWTTLLTEEPAAVAAPPMPPLGDAFDDYAILGLAAPYVGDVEDSLLGDYDPPSDDEDLYDDMYDDDGGSDSEIEDYDSRVRFWDGDATGSETDVVAGPLKFLGGQTRFASFQGAAGFMRLSAALARPGSEDDNREGGAIVVHYRLTRFSRTPSDAHGVEVRDFGTALHHVRYLVPFPVAGADAASSLRLVGASLAADVYPYRYYVQLQALWSRLVAVLPVSVPARAMRLVVTVDVGVLRGEEDRMPERMREALAALARENDDAAPMACGLEQHLPVPVPACCDCDDESGGGDRRPAKRMKRLAAVEGEVCAICHETLEQGLAAWPRCDHVFHGKCLEQLLVTVKHRCPMCRSTLSIKGMFD